MPISTPGVKTRALVLATIMKDKNTIRSAAVVSLLILRVMRSIHFYLAFMVFADFHQYATAEFFTALSCAQSL